MLFRSKAQLQLQQQQLAMAESSQKVNDQIKMMEQQRKTEKDEHDQMMAEMKEATARAKLELENQVDLPGGLV